MNNLLLNLINEYNFPSYQTTISIPNEPKADNTKKMEEKHRLITRYKNHTKTTPGT